MERLQLNKTKHEGLREGIRKDGKKYLVRDHRQRYFYPDEWEKFYNSLPLKSRLLFDFLIQTGCRINEALHIRPMDFDFDRNTVKLWKTKTRGKLKERSGRPRTISLSPSFMDRVKKNIKQRKIAFSSEEYLFPGQKGKKLTSATVHIMLKSKLKKIGINDWYNFSLHNIRKTHGNWIRALGIPAEEICLRLGHNFNTYLAHYGSPSVFNNADIIQINQILEGLYQIQRRY